LTKSLISHSIAHRTMRRLALVVIILLFSTLSGCLDNSSIDAQDDSPNDHDNDGIDDHEDNDVDGDGIDDDTEVNDGNDDTTIQHPAEIFSNQVYASTSTSDLLLDLYIPNGEGPHPLFVNIHGGGWVTGDKALHPGSAALQIYDSGNATWAVASINYRLINEAVWPAQIEDTKAAIRWLKVNADTYRIDSQMIVVGGSSAGGHLSAMLAVTNGDTIYDNSSLGSMNASSEVNAVVDWFGVTNMFTLSDYFESQNISKPWPMESLLACEMEVDCTNESVISASPALLVNGSEPPVLLMHGVNDTLIPPSQSQELATALSSNNSIYWHHEFTDAGHGIGNLEWRTSEVVDLLSAFLEAVMDGTISSNEIQPEPSLVTECLNGHSNLVMHIHPKIVIQIEDTTYTVAANVGVDTEACPSAMHVAHTHDTSGKIHVETHEQTNVSLGVFTQIWGIIFDETQFGPYHVNDTHELVMMVDGVVSEEWGGHIFSDGETILIHYRERQ
jgi:acetyl esterase/lipase